MSIPGKGITYTYDATGNKLNKNNGVTSTDYISGIQYDNGTITFIQTEEGRILNPTGTPDYEYSITDHLGDSRINFDSSHGGSVATQTNDYYPFGLTIQPNTTAPPNLYLYNKKELQTELGQYNYGARFYDPVIARWTSTDPMAESAYDLTPFRYGFNNPVRIVDPNGLYEEDGHYWSVYLVATQLGLRNARQLAEAAEWPDVASVPTYLIPAMQQRYHALTGGDSQYEAGVSEMMLSDANNMHDIGIALHRLGDSFAHRTLSNPNEMYGNSIFTLNHWFSDRGEPDEISRRPALFLQYIDLLTDQLIDKFNLSDNGKRDWFAFSYIADKNNKTDHNDNDAILSAEINILNGQKNFEVIGGHKGAVQSYLNTRGKVHAGPHYSVKTFEIDHYEKQPDGTFKKSRQTKDYAFEQ